MSITFGYDLKKGDKMVDAPDQITKLMRQFSVPGPALVNYLPFCALSNFIPAMPVVTKSYFSAGHSFVGPILQLQTTGTNS